MRKAQRLTKQLLGEESAANESQRQQDKSQPHELKHELFHCLQRWQRPHECGRLSLFKLSFLRQQEKALYCREAQQAIGQH